MGWIFDRIIYEAEKKGRKAQDAGAPLSDNPFPLSRLDERRAWSLAYIRQDNEEARKAPAAPVLG